MDTSALHFQNLTLFLLRMRTKYTLNCDICHFSMLLDAFPPRPKMPLTYVVNVYSHMALSKGHLGSRGCGGERGWRGKQVFRTHVQTEYGKVWEMTSTPILNILTLLLF